MPPEENKNSPNDHLANHRDQILKDIDQSALLFPQHLAFLSQMRLAVLDPNNKEEQLNNMSINLHRYLQSELIKEIQIYANAQKDPIIINLTERMLYSATEFATTHHFINLDAIKFDIFKRIMILDQKLAAEQPADFTEKRSALVTILKNATAAKDFVNIQQANSFLVAYEQREANKHAQQTQTTAATQPTVSPPTPPPRKDKIKQAYRQSVRKISDRLSNKNNKPQTKTPSATTSTSTANADMAAQLLAENARLPSQYKYYTKEATAKKTASQKKGPDPEKELFNLLLAEIQREIDKFPKPYTAKDEKKVKELAEIKGNIKARQNKSKSEWITFNSKAKEHRGKTAERDFNNFLAREEIESVTNNLLTKVNQFSLAASEPVLIKEIQSIREAMLDRSKDTYLRDISTEFAEIEKTKFPTIRNRFTEMVETELRTGTGNQYAELHNDAIDKMSNASSLKQLITELNLYQKKLEILEQFKIVPSENKELYLSIVAANTTNKLNKIHENMMFETLQTQEIKKIIEMQNTTDDNLKKILDVFEKRIYSAKNLSELKNEIDLFNQIKLAHTALTEISFKTENLSEDLSFRYKQNDLLNQYSTDNKYQDIHAAKKQFIQNYLSLIDQLEQQGNKKLLPKVLSRNKNKPAINDILKIITKDPAFLQIKLENHLASINQKSGKEHEKSAVTKLISLLENHHQSEKITFSTQELDALRKSQIGSTLARNAPLWPEAYKNAVIDDNQRMKQYMDRTHSIVFDTPKGP